MQLHKLTPEAILMFRERLKGCYICRHQKYKDDQGYCGAEQKLKVKLGFPTATKQDCRFFWRRQK